MADSKCFYVGPTSIPGDILGEEIVKALLHSVFLLRCFGTAVATPVMIEELDVAYGKVEDAEIDAQVSKCVRRFFDLQRAQTGTGEVVLRLYKLENTQSWFAQRTQQMVAWEEWTMGFKVQETGAVGGSSPQKPLADEEEKAKLATAVTRQLHYILKTVNTQRDHVPYIPTRNALMPFKYTLEVAETESQPKPFSLFKGLAGIWGEGPK